MRQFGNLGLERRDSLAESRRSRLPSPVVALVRPVVFGPVGVGALLRSGLGLVHTRHTKPYGPAMQP